MAITILYTDVASELGIEVPDPLNPFDLRVTSILSDLFPVASEP